LDRDYNNAGGGASDALEEILELERQVQPVRIAVHTGLSLFHVAIAIYYFDAGSSWTSAMLDKYEA
jgi:hypothetical protein